MKTIKEATKTLENKRVRIDKDKQLLYLPKDRRSFGAGTWGTIDYFVHVWAYNIVTNN